MSSIQPNGPIADYIKRTGITEEQFFADLKNRDVCVTSVYAAEEIAFSIQNLISSFGDQEGEYGGEYEDEAGYRGKKGQRDWW
ncbi:MAG: hypothetical protein IH989_05720 [Planctomycetes bacterium]|nr:hypothetical protein [Planctomycetota bacterium]